MFCLEYFVFNLVPVIVFEVISSTSKLKNMITDDRVHIASISINFLDCSHDHALRHK